jgi:hypothetical protein
MGSPSASSGSPSSGGTKAQAIQYAKKNEPNIIDKGSKKIKDFIYGGPEKGVLTETYSPKYGKYDVPGSLSDPREKDDTAAKASLFKEQGAINYQDSWMAKTMVGGLLSGPAKESTRANRSYFKNEVLGKGAYKDLSVQDFELKNKTTQEDIYQNYIQGRTKGELDAYGRKIKPKDGGNDGNNTIGQVTKTAPTTAEVSQATTAEAAGATAAETAKTTEANRLLKIKKKGRSQSIMTDPKGVTKTSTDYSLGKKSLLGIV